ncbi:MAG TPA: peroxidase-related enzyme [Xanthobacteraceae bacterium]|nr:peroxidase-related enzyme [Xanthobacteraceae bacterium]
MKPMRDFIHGELAWKPWVTPLDITAATQEQLAALKVTPSNRAVGAYSLVLAHDPEALNARSPLYNGIMFGAKGLPRAERELGAVTASRINGCAYCASVHALRFNQLAKQPEVIERIQRDGVAAELEPRLRAIVDYAAKLTRDPAAITPADAAPLRAQGLGDLEILDLTHAVAMFAWANRLMQTLGEAADPAAPGNPL